MFLLTDNNDLKVWFPENLNECSIDQLLRIQELSNNLEDLPNFSVEFLRICMLDDDFDELVALCPSEKLAEFANQVADSFLASEVFLTEQKIPILAVKDAEFRGPQDCLYDICFGQFVEADEQFLLYYKTQKIEHLNKMIAILYRPRDEIEYDNEINEAIISKIKTVDIGIKLIIHAFYSGCRQFISKQFKEVFPVKKESNQKKQLLFAEIRDMSKAYNAKMVQYAKSPDRKKKVYLVNVFTFFEFIEHDIIEYNQMIASTKK